MANNNHFELTLDTLAPTGSITRAFEFGKAKAAMTISKGDASLMKVWFNNAESGTKSDAGYTGGSWIAADTSYTTQFSTDGEYYYHLVLKDDVGNESEVYNTGKMTYDITKPTISAQDNINNYIKDPDGAAEVCYLITNQLKNELQFHYSDNLSKVNTGRLVIWGSAKDAATPIKSEVQITLDITKDVWKGDFDFPASSIDGQRDVDIYVTDRAGNESLVATYTIYLDRELTKPTLSLLTTAGGTLPPFINYHAIKANLVSNEADIVAYKIWEGSTEPEYTSVTKGKLNVTVALTLSDNDGEKTVHAKVKDSAGNEKAADNCTVTVDKVAPTASISRSGSQWISNISGFTTSEIKFSVADDRSGIKSYEVYCNGSKISEGTTAQTDTTLSITSATTGMKEGQNDFTVKAVDKAENEYTTTTAATVYLDTTAPTCSLGSLKVWYNEKFQLPNGDSSEYGTISYADGTGAGVAYICAWSDTSNASQATLPASPNWIAAKTTLLVTEITPYSPVQSANNYMHIAVKDAVGNVSTIATQKYGYDSEKPTGSIRFSQDVYSSVTATLNISGNEDTSGISYIYLDGHIDDTAGAAYKQKWIPYVTSKSITLTTGDGMKTVSCKFKDAAGNVSASAAEAICELDTSTPSGTLTLYEKGTTTAKAARSKDPNADAYITYSDDEFGSGYYKIWGQFHYYDESKTDKRGTALATTENDAQWIEIIPQAGKKSFTLNLICTTGDGQKNVSVRLKDNAEHIFPATDKPALTGNFVFDTTPPEVIVTNPDYNRISKVNVVRYNGTTATTDKCDEIKFTFHIGEGEYFQAYKVCAYKDQDAAKKGSHADNAIPTAGGSTNMSASGISQTGSVNCMIKGTDYEAALNGGTAYSGTDHKYDGAHYVVVYVQDVGGNWSVAAEFSA